MIITPRYAKKEKDGYVLKYAWSPHKCDLCDRVMWLGYYFSRWHWYKDTSQKPVKEWRCPECNPNWYKTGKGYNE